MTGHSTARESGAALGVRCHSGWAAFVVLKGPIEKPEISERGRIQLCDQTVEGSKQPFHTAEPMAFAAAEAFIGKCRRSTDAFADVALKEIVARHGRLRGCCLLTASGRPLPALRAVLASHSLIHAAEGEFYRDAMAGAASRLDIAVHRVRDRDLEEAAEAILVPTRSRNERVQAFGKLVGPPWGQDEKRSVVAAWLVLAARKTERRGGIRAGRVLEGS